MVPPTTAGTPATAGRQDRNDGSSNGKGKIATAKTTIATAKMMIAIAMTHQEWQYKKRIIKEYQAFLLLLFNWLHCVMMTKQMSECRDKS